VVAMVLIQAWLATAANEYIIPQDTVDPLLLEDFNIPLDATTIKVFENFFFQNIFNFV
jgi:hypothetical protein